MTSILVDVSSVGVAMTVTVWSRHVLHGDRFSHEPFCLGNYLSREFYELYRISYKTLVDESRMCQETGAGKRHIKQRDALKPL